MGPDMNASIRRAGNRTRTTQLPNIGQAPIVQAATAVQAMQGAGATGAAQQMPNAMQQPSVNPYAAPNVQAATATFHPPGEPADPMHYNYEPQPDGAWRVYPPGVQAPPHLQQASLPRAASTADYRRMQQAFQQPQMQPNANPQQPAAPMAPIPGY